MIAKLVLAFCFAVAAPAPPGVVIDYEPAQSGLYIGSPSIVILPNGDYVSSHDLFGPKAAHQTAPVTKIFRSRARGKTWQKMAQLDHQFWSNLFVHQGQVFLMGTNFEYGRIVIRRSLDNGATWSDAAFLTNDPGYHTAPVPMLEKDGRLWRAMEFHPDGPWGHFEAFMMSTPADGDLLDPNSWTMTERLPYPANAGEGATWLEGNAVAAPDGSVLDILRVANVEKAAILKVQSDKLRFEGLVEFPGGSKKFSIRYDPTTRMYWTLSNPALKEYAMSAKDPGSVRNTLVLMSSKDLHKWTIARTILSHPDPEKHGFQYVDWQFDQSDIVAVSRTGFDDDFGGPPRAHDANYLTFHRIQDFRKP